MGNINIAESEERTMSRELEWERESSRQMEEEKRSKVELSMLKPGETFLIGEHKFIVLEQEDGIARVISKGFMAEEVMFGERADYKISNLKKVIEKDIQPIIENEVGTDNIITHIVDLTSVDMQNEFGEVECKVRPITFDEARKYNDLLVNKDLPTWWFTCTPWPTCKLWEQRKWWFDIATVMPKGCLDKSMYYDKLGVRPFCILKSNIFVPRGVC